ncbi:aminotransferase class V-fold PLP-dependent enzyme [Solimonas sp. SE-A11]|uniref:aminotransferase class V-fold PLP-dependent enzyme n=1 Tax=Solimonas sp. SE-A11 TaxID=3054954 RepID=UPI00259CCB56|nr:aminotransferase class V-fold PLP-dependent enzyme [Solimonas sp. SE-A11]MDM4771264.1 aminotransferase class V-fold PLP-dependent enzyme [Solimonas sp. SE-A11]
MTSLDLDFVRTQFPAFAEPTLRDQAFFENAGGSYACRQVIDLLGDYYRRLKVQPYYSYPASIEAGAWMDASHERLAEYLGVGADELHFGPSTSQNTYVLAQAFRGLLQPGDEIVVTTQDHEANGGVWRRLAAEGFVLREWQVDPASGALDPDALDALLNERTRLVVFPQCSNIVAQLNPVARLTAKIRAAGALSLVDGVSYAPHGLPDLRALGADIYLFSLYKTFGPHQGLMVLGRELLDRLANQGHFFNASLPRKRLTPAGPDHAQIAAAGGIASYFDALDAHHHPGAALIGRAQRIRALLHDAEEPLLARLLDGLGQIKGLRILGPTDASQRAATVAVQVIGQSPAALVPALAQRGVLAAAGHFYAVRLLQAMGLDPKQGVLRLSFLHYNSTQDIERLLRALDELLTA